MSRFLRVKAVVVLGMQVALAGMAMAGSPAVVDKSQAVAGPRSDAGTGLCGSVTHFAAGSPLFTKADAVAILDKPTTDSIVLGRTARLFDNINFRNGQPNTNGDFTQPTYRDDIFPYSMDPLAAPMGTDANFVLRLRGYFNVPATLAGKTISFGINCDDFCALRIGTTDLTPPGNQLVSARVIKQISFPDAGLYPVELVYFQNGSTAYLEWSRSDVLVAECPNDICNVALTDPVKYPGNFNLLQAAELYSGVVGSNPACLECSTAGTNCAAGSYCGNGLCQSCNNADHCGDSCQACPATAHQCRAGACVECTADAQCASGMACEVASGHCKTALVTPPPTAVAGCTLGGPAAATARGGLVTGSLLALALYGLLRRRRSCRTSS